MDATLGDLPSADIAIEDGAMAAIGRALDAAGAESIDGSGMIAFQSAN